MQLEDTINKSNGLSLAKSIETVVTNNAEKGEQLRTLPPAIVDALWDSGLMAWMNPEEAGGSAPSFREMIDTWQELSRQDGSTGWVSIANFPSTAFAATYLDDQGFDEVFTRNNNRITMGGQFFPNGTGTKVDGGYQISGAWEFGSGIGHSQYIAGGFMPLENGEALMEENGMPVMMVAIFPADQVQITDGWNVQGLKGTGSFDYNVQDVFVSEHMTYPLFGAKRQRGSKIFDMGIMPLVAAGHAAWALGVARSMLDDVTALAIEKTRMGDMASLANKPTFQRDLAHHESMWRAARALLINTYADNESKALSGEALTLQRRADMRMAASYVTEASREVTQWAHLGAGTTAIREGCRMERAFRDMYTGTQHTFIGEKTYIDAAQVMLGLIDEAPGL